MPSSPAEPDHRAFKEAPRGVPAQDSEDLMAELKIRYNGRHFCFQAYRYDHLEDALAYARLQRDRALHGLDEDVTPEGATTGEPEFPATSDRPEMEALGVSYEAGRYVFQGFHYDHLRDALAYARLDRARGST
ncbi:hypothetical protein M8A51_01745 [Schlegelella sp. S2-27]|uniref:Uncharacterized protein n=1 Tax=Caldimonas mangrovi TaxID=2944811 RepID=A0ABT0YHM9_9BURK|nr:hypothetical protein [Caldimonas mangrovi]MCM5678246.1 hypothetical protein [Caldimonas mangrovi]